MECTIRLVRRAEHLITGPRRSQVERPNRLGAAEGPEDAARVKTFQRILGFQGFLVLAPTDRVGLARLAVQAGDADQTHLTRESVALAGVTPRVLLDERPRSCGSTHDHEVSFARLREALLTTG